MEDSASRNPRFAEGFELRHEESGDEIVNEESVPVLLDLRISRDRNEFFNRWLSDFHFINHKKILADPGAKRKKNLPKVSLFFSPQAVTVPTLTWHGSCLELTDDIAAIVALVLKLFLQLSDLLKEANDLVLLIGKFAAVVLGILKIVGVAVLVDDLGHLAVVVMLKELDVLWICILHGFKITKFTWTTASVVQANQAQPLSKTKRGPYCHGWSDKHHDERFA